MDIVAWLESVLRPLGTLGVLMIIFLFFYFDAILFPTLPEIFTLGMFTFEPSLAFAVEILITIIVAELLGLTTLYLIVKHLTIPKKIEQALEKYTRFLLVKDEKIILVNRIAPVLPFMGAFAAVCHWDFRKCVAYTLLGGVVKYSLILASSVVFFAYLKSGDAFLVSIILVMSIIVVSLVLSFTRRDKILGPKTEESTTSCDIEEK